MKLLEDIYYDWKVQGGMSFDKFKDMIKEYRRTRK